MANNVDIITNEEFYNSITPMIDELRRLRNDGKQTAIEIVGKTLFKEDLFFCASLDRCINLIDGFIELVQNRNLTCVGAILRLQIDNCMRIYAAFIAKEKYSVIDCLIYGRRIDHQKSIDGFCLTDSYLKRELSKLDPKVEIVYNNTSGYIHFSDRALYHTIKSCDDNAIEFEVGFPLLEKFNSTLIEVIDAFIHFVKLQYSILSNVVESKKKYDEDH